MQDPREIYYAQKLEALKGRPEFDLSSCELILNLVYTYGVIDAALNRQCHQNGVSSSAINLLDVLEQQENQCAPLNEIGRLLLVSRANVTGLVDSLAKRGLVERVPHPSDRRIRLARLLPAGQVLLAERRPRRLKMLRHMGEALVPAERAAMTDLLVRLRHHIQENIEELES